MGAVRPGPAPSHLLPKALRGTRLLAILMLAIGGCGFSTQPVEPLVAGAQRFFTLEWQATPRGAQRLVQGYIKNDWGFVATNVRLLVEGIEPPNRIVSQRIFSLGGDLAPGARAYFETPMSVTPTYRVRVFAFDWIQSGEMTSEGGCAPLPTLVARLRLAPPCLPPSKRIARAEPALE